MEKQKNEPFERPRLYLMSAEEVRFQPGVVITADFEITDNSGRRIAGRGSKKAAIRLGQQIADKARQSVYVRDPKGRLVETCQPGGSSNE